MATCSLISVAARFSVGAMGERVQRNDHYFFERAGAVDSIIRTRTFTLKGPAPPLRCAVPLRVPILAAVPTTVALLLLGRLTLKRGVPILAADRAPPWRRALLALTMPAPTPFLLPHGLCVHDTAL